MKSKKNIIFVVITLVSGLISFFSSRLNAMAQQEQAQQISREITAQDEQFNNDTEQLIVNMEELQGSLETAIEDPGSTNETILQQAENVSEAHEQLLHRVGRHVINLRRRLTGQNRQYLMQLCAGTVSGPMRRMAALTGTTGSQGQGRGNRFGRQGNTTRGYGYRRGQEQNSNAGNGRRLRFRNGLTTRLQLTDEQVTLLQENDPDFEVEAENLCNVLIAERQKLLSSFLNSQSSDDELMQQIDNFVSAHSRLEKRILQHILVMRSGLTDEQLKQLVGLCSRFEGNQ